MSKDTALLVAAIDFGTTYSGYAFSFRNEFERDPLRVNASSWTSGSRVNTSLKTSSCILFNPSCKFDSFGFEAEDKYSDLALDNKHGDWFFFRRFKMLLYNSKDVHRTTKIKDETGKELFAMDVFSAAIRYLKDHLLHSCLDQMYETDLDEKEIRWVLTVPAIWDDAAKQFMREAAEKPKDGEECIREICKKTMEAGISHESLVLALEPEAASMFCKHLPVERMMGAPDKKISCFKPKSKYLVLDAGGGTVDITVHEVENDGTLRELCKANGGPWGGLTVDKAFVRFMQNVTGPDVFERFRNDQKEDYIELMGEFEIKKRSVHPEMDSKVTFRIPISLYELYRDLKNEEIREAARNNPSLSGNVTFAGDKMRVEAEVVKSFFKETISTIINHIKRLLDDPVAQDVTSILMVGGFSESTMLCAEVQRAFPSLRIIVPHEAGLAVLKGAVIFGHNRNAIASRIARYTYGLAVCSRFNPNKHPKERIIKDGEELLVRGCFSKLVEVGQSVSAQYPSKKKCYRPLKRNASFLIQLFASPRKEPMFVDEPDCISLGNVFVDCKDGLGNVAGAYVWLIFGGTELEVKAEHETTGKQTKASFDFLG